MNANLSTQSNADYISTLPLTNLANSAPSIRYLDQGENFFVATDANNTHIRETYIVTTGEIVITRNGRPVDLIEEGEYLDPGMWSGVEATALTNCELSVVTHSNERVGQKQLIL
ncbi:hypothetical protein KFU94_29045 [Chloroflexi bacterium TSY]|nr:hypothetical protein [Chloroflexi bacterium TSY]